MEIEEEETKTVEKSIARGKEEAKGERKSKSKEGEDERARGNIDERSRKGVVEKDHPHQTSATCQDSVGLTKHNKETTRATHLGVCMKYT